jgi:hypothetical protein
VNWAGVECSWVHAEWEPAELCEVGRHKKRELWRFSHDLLAFLLTNLVELNDTLTDWLTCSPADLLTCLYTCTSTLTQPLRRYGTRAVDQLRQYYEGQIADVMSEDEEAAAAAAPAGNRSSNGPAAAATAQGVSCCSCCACSLFVVVCFAFQGSAVFLKGGARVTVDYVLVGCACCLAPACTTPTQVGPPPSLWLRARSLVGHTKAAERSAPAARSHLGACRGATSAHPVSHTLNSRPSVASPQSLSHKHHD